MPISSRFVVRSTIGLLTVGFVALFCIVGATIWLGERSRHYFNEVIQARDTRGSAVELRDALRAAESSQRGFLVTGNEVYLAPFDSAKALVLRQLETLGRNLAPYPETRPMLQRLSSVVTDKIREMDQTVALKNDRRDEEALAIIRSNRGKALMDEANVFLYGIILAADDRLTVGVDEQRTNAAMLRWVSILGAVVIILVVAGVTITILRYAREIAHARDEVSALNAGLEERVKRRTADLAQARDRAEVLLAEVNHRVANSLALVASLVKLQANAAKSGPAAIALAETEARIYAISLVHKRLYTSGDARFVSLDEYLTGLLEHLETAMRAAGHGATLRYEVAPLKLPTDAAITLGVIVTEWVTNAFKYAYPDRAGTVRVRLRDLGEGRAALAVEDDGVGRGAGQSAQGTGLGSRIVTAMASTMNAEIRYVDRAPGTSAQLSFSLPPG